MQDHPPKLADEYKNWSRFCLEAVKASADDMGPNRLGIRLAPYTNRLDLFDSTEHLSLLA